MKRVPLTVTAESPWEQVTVQVDRLEKNLWFQRADLTAPVSMALPRSHGSPEGNERFLHGWANGPLLCLRVGTDLFGFWISDPDGKLPKRPLWPRNSQTFSVAGDRPPLVLGFSENSEDSRPLWDDSFPGYFDIFSRPIGRVGPVRAAYLCYQDRGNLVALDSTSGREIWCRSDLPLGTHCIGDDDHVVLLHSDSSSVEVLRSIDGATIADWDWRELIDADQRPGDFLSHDEFLSHDNFLSHDDFLSRIVAVHGTLALWHSHPPQRQGEDSGLDDGGAGIIPEMTTAAVIDLSHGRRLWSRTVSRGSWMFKLDDRLLGSLSPDGTLTLLDWETGNAVAEHTVDVPRVITNVFVMTHAERVFVIASDRPDDRRLLGARQIRNADRRPLVNGWMYAIDRASARQLWTREMANVGMILDQPRHVPLFVTSYLIQENSGRQQTGVLKCIDTRTGELLYEQTLPRSHYIYHAVRSDLQQNRVEVVLAKKMVRFQYEAAE